MRILGETSHIDERWWAFGFPKTTPSPCLSVLSICELVSSVHREVHPGLGQQHLHYKMAAALGPLSAAFWAGVQSNGAAKPWGVLGVCSCFTAGISITVCSLGPSERSCKFAECCPVQGDVLLLHGLHGTVMLCIC